MLCYVTCSDIFLFQDNGIKKVHMFENNAVFWKTMGFLSNVFDTTSHMIYFDYKAYAFYENKNYSCFTLNFFS